ncbi:alpha/beta hydrolase [Streptomyces sp. NPDC048275]|uniref:alpha/beta hydrolase n=1 Tax=Streptomyces sp. NPDC048275 TaxID=3155629 RepID=UPI0033F74D7F
MNTQPPDPHHASDPPRPTRSGPVPRWTAKLRRSLHRTLTEPPTLRHGRVGDIVAPGALHQWWTQVWRTGLVAVVAGGVLLSMLLIHGSPVPGFKSAAAGFDASRSAELRPFYTQKITWHACGTGVQCGQLEVPLDYADPDGPTIQLALARRLATDPDERIGSLVHNPGGPGGSGVEMVQGSIPLTSEKVHSQYDIVSFDPRGVAQSAPIRCAPPAEPADYVSLDITPDNPAEVTTFVEYQKEYGAACQAGSGERLAHVSTRETARDLDVLRAALGDEKLNYLGVSYGTEIGTAYAEEFPDRVGRMVLDAAVDPRINRLDFLRDQAAGFQLTLDAFLTDCATKADCRLGTDLPGARQRLNELLASLDRKPLPAAEAGTLDRDTAVGAIGQAMYNKEAWPALRAALEQALAGNGADLGLMALSGGPGGNFSDAFAAINCLDFPPAVTSAEQIQAQLPSFRKASPVFGESFAWEALSCTNWPAKPVGTPHEVNAPGAPPILVVGTTRDPATPYVWAQGLAEQLDSGVLLTREGDGHSGYVMGSTCVDDAVDTYLLQGRPPADGTRCA